MTINPSAVYEVGQEGCFGYISNWWWEMGQHDDVVDLLLAMKGDFHPALRRAGLE